MIERLTGTVVAKTAESVVIDVGGVGFLLDASAVTLRDMPAIDERTTVFAHLHVREEVLQLYGLGVSKIGPKLALAALSYRRPPDLKRALAGGDVALLSSVPGIGKKTAERLILELREKVGELGLAADAAAAGGVPVDDEPLALARAALVELGYSVAEADKLLISLDGDRPVEELVRDALLRRA
jgi:Holliday junction DNA helicase RuvA